MDVEIEKRADDEAWTLTIAVQAASKDYAAKKMAALKESIPGDLVFLMLEAAFQEGAVAALELLVSAEKQA